MIVLKKFSRLLKRFPDYFKTILICFLVIYVALLIPINKSFRYQFNIGQTWNYADLYAPHDFNLLKFNEEIQLEKRIIDSLQLPVYSFRDASVRYDIQTDPHLNELLKTIYKDGIIEDSLYAKPKLVKFGNGISKDFLKLHRLSDVRNRIVKVDNQFDINLIQPNVKYDGEFTNELKVESLKLISSFQGKISSGELIVNEGSIITKEVYRKLISLRDQNDILKSESKASNWINFIGYIILIGSLILIFLYYHWYNAISVLQKFNRFVFIFFWIGLYATITYFVVNIFHLNIYVIPFCIVPLVIKNIFNDRTAILLHILNIIICSFIGFVGFEFLIIQLMAGMVAIMITFETRFWSKFFDLIIRILVSYLVSYFAFALILNNYANKIIYKDINWILIGVLLTILAYPVIPLFEKIIGYTSAMTLVELSDLKHPLLRKLSIKAPGTMQHSLQVAHLAEAAANQIKANSLLVKVGALYHDIGKINKPQYFVENQDGIISPHQELDALSSARIIIDHVSDGVNLAKRYNIPKDIIDFIRTHHGTTRVEFFYNQYQLEQTEALVNDAVFRYPGPRPKTKEQSIVMLADSVEASSRLLPHHVKEADIEELVQKIISLKRKTGQLDESELSFKELGKCKTVFIKILKGMYHSRIDYPESKEPDSE